MIITLTLSNTWGKFDIYDVVGAGYASVIR